MISKICVVTGCRSDYGLLTPLLRNIQEAKDFDLQIIATGAHLSSDFGYTYKLIHKDGFKINSKVMLDLSNDSNLGIARSVGVGVSGFSGALFKLKPDLMIVLGDRFEIFAAVAAAYLLRIPIAHLHGGELTEGSLDDGLRHAITKLSTLHFCSTEIYRNRVIQMGEDPKRVFNVGALGIDNIHKMNLLSKSSLEKELGISLTKNTVLVTFYPSTAEGSTAVDEFKELLSALDELRELKVIFTKPASDIGANVICKLIDKYVSFHKSKAFAFINLGQLKYLSLIKYVLAVVGNSSSGIIEVPSLAKPTVNIGNRQAGRIAAESVINCKPIRSHVIQAIKRSSTLKFQSLCKNVKNPYGDGRSTEKIYKILRENISKHICVSKKFYNLRVK